MPDRFPMPAPEHFCERCGESTTEGANCVDCGAACCSKHIAQCAGCNDPWCEKCLAKRPFHGGLCDPCVDKFDIGPECICIRVDVDRDDASGCEFHNESSEWNRWRRRVEAATAKKEDPGWTEGLTTLVMQGNEFSVLAFLQHAQNHLMRTERGIDSTLTVSLDGDFAAILRLQSAESDVLAWAINKAVDRAIDRIAA